MGGVGWMDVLLLVYGFDPRGRKKPHAAGPMHTHTQAEREIDQDVRTRPERSMERRPWVRLRTAAEGLKEAGMNAETVAREAMKKAATRMV